MPSTGAEVIDAARGLDSSFSRQNHPNRVCLEFLTRYQRRLSGKMIRVDRMSISSEITFDLPLADFDAGLPLEVVATPVEYDRIHGFHLLDENDERSSLPVTSFKDRITSTRSRYGWLEENTLFLSDAAQDWVSWTNIIFVYAPTATAVVLGTDMIFPDSAFDVVVLGLGSEMGKRKPQLLERTTIVDEHDLAEKAYLNLIEERDGATIGSVRRVFSL